ncbi:MAG TPA: K(+)-transporting ATPase subunit C [Solirubrobacterales bacterium]|jgi:K+-transporting ATPase ATPase C chain|nr:K(+)-transporting ATPase subunit C [Solirubrobacterales bacterium]
MRRTALTALLAVIAFTVVCGLAYPLAMTGLSQLLFPGKADGSRIVVDGELIGSSLIGQDFKGDRRYFQSRPSQSEYAANTTYFGNSGPNSVEGREAVRENLAAYVKLEKPYDRSLTRADVPVDAIATSGSGVDPHISEANARIQAHRVAAVRQLSLTEVEDLISAHTDGRALGLFGEPGVNVLRLNIALDDEAPIE